MTKPPALLASPPIPLPLSLHHHHPPSHPSPSSSTILFPLVRISSSLFFPSLRFYSLSSSSLARFLQPTLTLPTPPLPLRDSAHSPPLLSSLRLPHASHLAQLAPTRAHRITTEGELFMRSPIHDDTLSCPVKVSSKFVACSCLNRACMSCPHGLVWLTLSRSRTSLPSS